MGSRRTPVLLAALFGVGLGIVAPLSVGGGSDEDAIPLRPSAVPRAAAGAPRDARAPAARTDLSSVSRGR
jgi:hypothetical protein